VTARTWKRGWRPVVVSAVATVVVVFAVAEIGLRLSSWERTAFALNELPVPGLFGDYTPNQRGQVELGDPADPWVYSFTTNPQGFRGPTIERPKPAGVFRILAVGDSYTWGDGVGDRDVWVRRLEANLGACGRVEVVNAGFVGRNTVGEADFLAAKGMTAQPDLILVGAEPGDAMDVLTLDRDWDNRAASVAASRPGWLVLSFGRTRVGRLFFGSRIARRSAAIERPADADGAWDRVRESFGRMAQTAGDTPLLVLGIAPSPDDAWTVERLEAEVAAAGLPFANVAPRVDERGAGPGWWEIPDDGHYTPEGNQVLAEVIQEELVSRGLLPGALAGDCRTQSAQSM